MYRPQVRYPSVFDFPCKGGQEDLQVLLLDPGHVQLLTLAHNQ